MAYDPNVTAVLREFRLVDDAGQPIQVVLRDGGAGPKLDQDVIDRFLATDTTPDKHWLRWMLHQAAGGDKAKDASIRVLEQIKDRFINERVNGFQNPDTGDTYPPVSREEADARWAKAQVRFRDILSCADQDTVQKLGAYGFYRKWPGSQHNRIYEKVVQAVTSYLKFYKKVLQMNNELEHDGKETVGTEPDQIKTWEDMDKITKQVERYFASKVARDDIRLANWKKEDWIYNDDYVTAIAPLTYAAAVKYGWDAWQFASREGFDRALANEQAWNTDPWKAALSKGKMFVYIRFNVAVPRWVSRAGGKFQVLQLTHLALEIDTGNLSSIDTDNIVVYDEEGRSTMRVGDVKNMIMAEPERGVDPQDEEMPIKRGPNVYKSKQEAQEVIQHLDMALAEIVEWAAHFDTKTIKADMMKLD